MSDLVGHVSSWLLERVLSSGVEIYCAAAGGMSIVWYWSNEKSSGKIHGWKSSNIHQPERGRWRGVGEFIGGQQTGCSLQLCVPRFAPFIDECDKGWLNFNESFSSFRSIGENSVMRLFEVVRWEWGEGGLLCQLFSEFRERSVFNKRTVRLESGIKLAFYWQRVESYYLACSEDLWIIQGAIKRIVSRIFFLFFSFVSIPLALCPIYLEIASIQTSRWNNWSDYSCNRG